MCDGANFRKRFWPLNCLRIWGAFADTFIIFPPRISRNNFVKFPNYFDHFRTFQRYRNTPDNVSLSYLVSDQFWCASALRSHVDNTEMTTPPKLFRCRRNYSRHSLNHIPYIINASSTIQTGEHLACDPSRFDYSQSWLQNSFGSIINSGIVTSICAPMCARITFMISLVSIPLPRDIMNIRLSVSLWFNSWSLYPLTSIRFHSLSRIVLRCPCNSHYKSVLPYYLMT
jgi:hypothetical protein